jgi:hypothetical protein
MTLIVGLLAPMTAQAAPPGGLPPQSSEAAVSSAPAVPQESPDPKATILAESSEVEKVRAVRAIEVGEATDEWLMLSDKNFVFKVYDEVSPEKYPLTKAEAYRVYRIMVDTADAPDATAFIRTGIHDFVDRDHIAYANRQEEARQAREARQRAAAFAEIPADAAMLDGNDQNFVYQVFRRSIGPKVRDGAITAWGGDAAVWKAFITTTIYTLHIEDQRDAIEKAKQESEEAARLLAAKQAKKNAASVLGIIAPEGWLVLTDDDFIRQLLTTAEIALPRRIEVRNAANAALRSSSPADWKAFIDTGIHAADQRDAAREKAAREEADRQKVREIKAKAEAGRLLPRLVAAATTALAGTPADVTRFLAETQYAVLNQSLMATSAATQSKGWYVRSSGGNAVITPGTPSTTVADAPLGYATWKVVTGLADPNCYSFESVNRVGSYLRQSSYRVGLVASDGTDQFKKDATWCARPGLSGSGVSLESKALAGRYLRHVGSQLWAANNSAVNSWDKAANYAAEVTWNSVNPDPLITTPIMLRYLNDDDWRSFVGSATAAEVVDGTVRYRSFANSRAYWSQATGVHNVWGPILTKYLAVGGHKYRMPIGDSFGTPTKPGAYNHFENGMSIFYSDSTGAHQVHGNVRDHWESLGWEQSYLGFPTSDEYVAGTNLRRSDFQGGYITCDLTTGRTWDTRR